MLIHRIRYARVQSAVPGGEKLAHVFVIGGGIVGLSCALSLLARGEQVTLVDDDPQGLAASWGNAGHIAVEQVEPLASPATIRSLPRNLFSLGGSACFPPGAMPQWLPFGLRLLKASAPSNFARGREALRGLLGMAMPAWQRLASDIGDPDILRTQGHLITWHDAKAAARGRNAWLCADTGTARVVDAAPGDVAAIAAVCCLPPVAAMRFAGSGQIADLTRLRTGLLAAFRLRGGEVISATASLRRVGKRVELTGIATDKVLICAGARSATLLAALGNRVPLIAERGYHLRCDASGWPADMPPLVFEDRSMIVTRYDSALQLAGFVEFSRVGAPADARKWQRLEHHAAELGLPVRGSFERWMGCRPTLPDYRPAIGRARVADNLYYAFGHQHLGLTLGPLTGELMASLLVGDEPSVPLAPFDLGRFA